MTTVSPSFASENPVYSSKSSGWIIVTDAPAQEFSIFISPKLTSLKYPSHTFFA